MPSAPGLVLAQTLVRPRLLQPYTCAPRPHLHAIMLQVELLEWRTVHLDDGVLYQCVGPHLQVVRMIRSLSCIDLLYAGNVHISCILATQ